MFFIIPKLLAYHDMFDITYFASPVTKLTFEMIIMLINEYGLL